jgi:hypothetical protein
MTKLIISELNPVGSELFQDSESFLEDLSEREINSIVGGIDTVVTQNSISVGSINTATFVGISQTNVTVAVSNVNASNVNASNVIVTSPG